MPPDTTSSHRAIAAGGTKRTHLALLGVLLVGYCVLFVAAGRFTQTDEIAFKAAGVEWARSGRFAAPELAGFLGLSPPVEEIWIAQMPGYPFLFGVAVKVFGASQTTAVAFDTIIHAVLAALTYLLASRLSGGMSRLALCAALLALPIAFPGRADELATCLGLAALLTVNRSRITAGAFLGLAGATSVVAGGLYALLAIGFLVVENGGNRVSRTAIMALVAAIVFASALAPILIRHPDAVNQFWGHAARQVNPPYAFGIPFTLRYGYSVVLLLVACLVLLVRALGEREVRRSRYSRQIIMAVAALALLVLLYPAKYYYLGFVAPLMISVSAGAVARFRVGWPTTLAAAMIYLLAASGSVRSTAIMLSLPADQQLEPNLRTIRSVVPRGSTLLASEFWPSLTSDYHYLSLVHGSPHPASVDYVILLGNGAGKPGETQLLESPMSASIVEDFVVVHDNLPRDVPRLAGIPLSRSSWGYGTRILQRRRPGRDTKEGPATAGLSHAVDVSHSK